MSTVVTIAKSLIEAEMIVGMLRNYGIRASASGVDDWSQYPSIQAQGVRVMVPDGKVDQARRLLGNSAGSQSGAGDLNKFQRLILRMLGGSNPPS